MKKKIEKFEKILEKVSADDELVSYKQESAPTPAQRRNIGKRIRPSSMGRNTLCWRITMAGNGAWIGNPSIRTPPTTEGRKGLHV